MVWAARIMFLVVNLIALTAVYCYPNKDVPISRPGIMLIAIGDAFLLGLGGFFA